MKIAFDYQIFEQQRFGGISRYFVELAQALKSKQNNIKVIAPLHLNNYLADTSALKVIGLKLNKFPKGRSRKVRTLNRRITNGYINLWKPNILHQTYFELPKYDKTNVPKVITVHDMIYEIFPEIMGRHNSIPDIKRRSCIYADRIICISENTKKDLLEFINIPEEKISVVHLGASPFKHMSALPAKKVGGTAEKPFILFIGNRGEYKNFNGLIAAVAKSKFLLREFDIVAFGGQEFTAQEITKIHQLGFSDNQVRQTAGDDQKLNWHYRNAAIFVYPSLYEGFGMPPLEAMSCGCPVASSNTSSMPEIIGDAAEFFDPSSLESIATAIETILKSQSRSDNLIEKGFERIKKFTWEECASKTLDVYKSVS